MTLNIYSTEMMLNIENHGFEYLTHADGVLKKNRKPCFDIDSSPSHSTANVRLCLTWFQDGVYVSKITKNLCIKRIVIIKN